MALLEALSWVLYLVIGALVFGSRWFLPCAYVVPAIFLVQYVILIWMIPLNLNWSRGLHSSLLLKSLFLFCATIFSFALMFLIRGVVDTTDGSVLHEFASSLYFSITTWTTLGFGDLKPPSSIRLLTSLEAMLGVLSMPLIFTLIWKYCDFRIRDTSSEDEQQERTGFRVRQSELGVWKQIDADGRDIDLKVSYGLNGCRRCGASNLSVERYFDILGIVSPRMRFMVHCTCGQHVYNCFTAMGAAKAWNRKNKTGEQ